MQNVLNNYHYYFGSLIQIAIKHELCGIKYLKKLNVNYIQENICRPFIQKQGKVKDKYFWYSWWISIHKGKCI